MSFKALLFGVVVLLLATGCSSSTKTVRVAVPPRVNLLAYPLVGLVTFTSNAKGELNRLGTQKFLEAVQAAQPGTRVVELGSEQQVLASVGANVWEPATLKAIREKHGVDVIVLGRLDVERAATDFNFSTVVKKLSVRQDVNASLATRLLETRGGATLWADGTKLSTNVAHAGFNDRGEGTFKASDPEAAYGDMLDALVWEVTNDFREHYVTRRVRKDDPAYASVAD